MLYRLIASLVAAPLLMFGPVSSVMAADEGPGEANAVLARNDDNEDPTLIGPDEDDDDQDRKRGTGGDTEDRNSGGATSGRDSNDRTNSRRTGVSRDNDHSRGDLTRDRTKDGRGGPTRDRSRHQTNDRSRHDTR